MKEEKAKELRERLASIAPIETAIIAVAREMGWGVSKDSGGTYICSPGGKVFLSDDSEAHKLLMLEILERLGWGINEIGKGAWCITEWSKEFDSPVAIPPDEVVYSFSDLPLAVIGEYKKRMEGK